MADIYFKCTCGRNLAVDVSGVGGMVRCPDCQAKVVIPEAAIKWFCPRCGAALQAGREMGGVWVECLACNSEIQVAEIQAGAEEEVLSRHLSAKADSAATAEPSEPADASGEEDLSANLNRLFKACPQCRERIPAHTRQCPFCEHEFVKKKSNRVVIGALLAVIVLGVLLGLWRAGIWPFGSAQPAAPAPPPPLPETNVAVLPPVPPVQPEPAVTSAPPPEVPVVAPEPPAAPSREAWLTRFELARQDMTAQLDKGYPWCVTNQAVNWRQSDGVMVQGTFAGAAGAGVTIRVNDNPVAVAFQDLDAYDRLTVDRDFRSAWIDAQASALSWRLLQPAGLGQTNETAALDAAVLDRALALGVPQAQYQVGQQFYKQRDYGYALLYLLAAAPGHAGAQFLLGGMRFQGLGAAADKKAGLTWLALAAAQGQARAEQFLQQQKLSAEVRQKLLQQEQSRQEQELKTLAGRAAAPNRAGTRAAVMPDLTLTAPLKPDDPVVFNDPLTGRSYSYRQGRKTYRD